MKNRITSPVPFLKTAGFTMLELIAVLVLLGILAVSISLRTGSGNDMQAAADVLAAHIRYAQSLAMGTDDEWSIRFTANSYTLLHNTIATPLPGQPDSQKDFPGAVSLIFSGGGALPCTLGFNYKGTPTALCNGTASTGPWTIQLRDADTGEQVQMAIFQLTGFVQY